MTLQWNQEAQPRGFTSVLYIVDVISMENYGQFENRPEKTLWEQSVKLSTFTLRSRDSREFLFPT